MLQNKFKYLILFIFLLFTGCTADYELEIKDGKAIETFSVINSNSSSWDEDVGGISYRELIDIYEQNPPKVYSYLIYGGDDPEEDRNYDDQEDVKNKEFTIDPVYKSEKISNNSELGIKLSYDFDIENYKDSSILDYYLTNLSITLTEDNVLKIYATPEWKIFSRYSELDTINITIKTDYEIIKANADSNNSGVLKWKVDKNSSRYGKTIVLELNLNETKNYFPEYIVYIVLICAVIFIAFIGYKIYCKVKSADEV